MPDVVVDVSALLEVAHIAVFVLLTALATDGAARSGPRRWALAAFGAAALALLGFSLPERLDVELPAAASRLLIVALLAFPYLLLRFTASFAALPRPWEAVAGGAAVLVAVVTAVLPVVPEPGAALPGWVLAYVVLVLTYWVATSAVVVVRLWAAGRGQPTVARRRMRLMAAATAVLTLALLLAAPLGDDAGIVADLVLLIVVLSGATFALGFSPPLWLRLRWRRPEDVQLQRGTVAVLRAGDVDEVARELLPPTARIVMASGVELLAGDGRRLATHGSVPDEGAANPGVHVPVREVVALPGGRGELVVWTSPYTPFFGPDETGLLQSMAAVASLALERCELVAEERARLAALEAAQHEMRRAQEEATTANLAKTRFLSRMSHELRTPLNAILGFGQVLEVTPDLDAEDRDAVRHIVKAGRHLLDLIDEVLDLSRIEAGTLAISLEPVQAAEVVADAVGLIRPLADSRQIALVVAPVAPGLHVSTDRQRCRQVLLNLLANAVKYNRDGGTVEVRCVPADAGRLRLSVTDTGPGIPPERLDRLFEPFDRLGAEGSGVEGTGLGLALSKQLVELMDGTIGVRSEPGEGTTAWVDLPSADEPPEPAVAVEHRPLPGTTGRTRLLLIEDNASNLRVVEAMLRSRPGITVVPAMLGRLALELASELVPDVVVLDLHLPDMPGEDVLHRLRADPRTRAIPVVVASADATAGRQRQILADGAYAYLSKPLDHGRFLEVVDGALALGRGE
jgi:signal transduction histidine kinase